jgi:hypothetical protein
MSARKEFMWEERPNTQYVLCDVPEALLHANKAAWPVSILAVSAGLVSGFGASARSQQF